MAGNRRNGIESLASPATDEHPSPAPADLHDHLRRNYDIDARSIEPIAGGWEADCFVVDDTWFVKAWRREPPTNLALLDQLAQRGLPVVPPRPTTDGRWSTPMCAVFPFVRGHRAPDEPVLIAGLLRRVHAIRDVDLPHTTTDEWCIGYLREHLDHPWIADRRDELAAAVDRLEAVTERARTGPPSPHVLVHNDLYGDNVLVDDDGEVLAILDWDHACLAPREHDLWMLTDHERPGDLLTAYGASDLDAIHLEFALVARALRDLAVRVHEESDRPGVDEWGFRRLARVDTVLELAR
jgi:hypothetical protein